MKHEWLKFKRKQYYFPNDHCKGKHPKRPPNHWKQLFAWWVASNEMKIN